MLLKVDMIYQENSNIKYTFSNCGQYLFNIIFHA